MMVPPVKALTPHLQAVRLKRGKHYAPQGIFEFIYPAHKH
jgi:hypothetical protein